MCVCTNHMSVLAGPDIINNKIAQFNITFYTKNVSPSSTKTVYFYMNYLGRKKVILFEKKIGIVGKTKTVIFLKETKYIKNKTFISIMLSEYFKIHLMHQFTSVFC